MSHLHRYGVPSTARRAALQLAGDAPDGVEGEPYTFQYALTGGRGPYTVTVVDGTLPSGLTITPTVQEGGRPTLTGTLPQVP